jgi:hypothetical protein
MKKSADSAKQGKRGQSKQYFAAVRIGAEQEVFVFDKKRQRDLFLKDIGSMKGVEWMKADPPR